MIILMTIVVIILVIIVVTIVVIIIVVVVVVVIIIWGLPEGLRSREGQVLAHASRVGFILDFIRLTIIMFIYYLLYFDSSTVFLSPLMSPIPIIVIYYTLYNKNDCHN